MVSRLTSSYPSSKHLLSCTPPRKNEKKKHSQFWLLRSTAPREEEIAVASRLHPPWPIVDLKLRVFHSTKVEWTSSFSRHRLCFFCQICSTYVDGRVKEKIWTQDLFQTRFVMRMCVCIIYSSWLNLFEIVWDFSWLWSLKDFCWKINYSGHWSFLLDCSRCTRLASEIDATALSGSTGLIPSNLVLMAPYSGHWLPTIRVVVPWLSSYQSTSNSKFNVYNCTPYTIIYILQYCITFQETMPCRNGHGQQLLRSGKRNTIILKNLISKHNSTLHHHHWLPSCQYRQ